MFYLTIVNKVLCHCHFWLARQYMLYLLMFTYLSANANRLVTDQTASIGAARSGPLLFVEEEKNIISAGYRAGNDIFVVGAQGINYI